MLELRQNNSIIMTREVRLAPATRMPSFGSVVLTGRCRGVAWQGAKNRGSASCDVAVTDCLTMHLQEQIQQLIQAGSPLYTSQRRYMYYLPELQRECRRSPFCPPPCQLPPGVSFASHAVHRACRFQARSWTVQRFGGILS